jgi:hypothetical protein
MFWNGPRRIRLTRALLDTFNRGELTILLKTLDQDLDRIAAPGNNPDVFGQVVDNAVRGKWVDRLVEAAVAEKKSAATRFEEFRRSESGGAPGAGRKRDLLPFLCDRTRQDRAFKDHVAQLGLSTAPRRPLVCVVHGDEQQGAIEYGDRLSAKLLPGVFNSEVGQAYDLNWPPPGYATDLFHGFFSYDLGEQCGRSGATLTDLSAFLNQHKVALVRTYIDTDAWRSCGVAGFEQFLAFWEKWPALTAAQWLVVCVRIEYVPPIPGLRRWLSRFLPFLAPRQTANARLRDYLGPPHRFSARPGVEMLVLPKLENVTRTEAVQWVLTEVPDKYYSRSVLKRRVEKLFSGAETLPLRPLAEKLQTILGDCSSG